MREEEEECRKRTGTGWQRVFLEAPACLTHSFSRWGPMCVVASSGLAHDGNTETDWKRNTFLAIKDGLLEFGTFAACDCLCADVIRWGAELRSPRAPFVVFGWVSVLCTLALALVHKLLRPHINAAAHVASRVCVGGDPCDPHGTHRGLVQTQMTLHQHPDQNIWNIVAAEDHTVIRDSSPSCRCSCFSIWQTWDGCRWCENVTLYGRGAVVPRKRKSFHVVRLRIKFLYSLSLTVLAVFEVKPSLKLHLTGALY